MMDVTLTVVATETGSAADVRVTSSDAAPAAPLLEALRATVAAATDAPMTLDGRSVPFDGSVTDCALRDGAIVCIGSTIEPAPPALIELRVVSGPDAGRRLSLPPGEHVIGRGPDAGLLIADGSISRRHLLVAVTSEAIVLTDLGSANGTTLDAEPLPPHHPTAVRTGSWLVIGHSQRHICTAAPATRDRNVVIHRAPRLHSAGPVASVDFPDPPSRPTPVRVPILAAVAPVVAGVVLSVVLHQWQFLAFTALSPVMVLGQAASDHRSSRRTFRRASREHAVATAAAHGRLADALRNERRQQYVDAPDLAQLADAARHHAGVLWHRGASEPDAMRLRLGRGDRPSNVQVVGGPSATLVDVPICVPMPEVGVLGICGPRDEVTGLARSLLIQAATLHSPTQLRVVVLAPGNAETWSWTRWLPHLGARGGEASPVLVGFDDAEVSTRVRELNDRRLDAAPRHTHTLVIVDGTAAMRGSAALARLTGHAGGDTSIIWCSGDIGQLPSEATAIAAVSTTPHAELILTRNGHRHPTPVRPDLIATDVASDVARAMAPLRDSTSAQGTGPPSTVRWEQVADVDLRDHRSAVRALTRHWARGPSTSVSLGQCHDELATIDLCRDGPHALIAGTTGSGKSELLLSLVASLAARNRPDQLSLLLIDHKGGAVFGPCARLPHTVGVVTDLDAESTKRALLSLTAELRRREALFATVAATDLESYAAAGAEPLARLVIVVDEFATLAEEQPEFVGGLVGIAQRGRSLGVHLVLATQRPDGVVSADIRANTRLRICLGVARENESRDVIDCPDAVTISRTTPGRAYLRIGPGELREFQTARFGGGRADEGGLTVTLSPAAMLGAPLPRPPAPADGHEPGADLDLLIMAALEVSAALGASTPSPPWLPPLPDRLALSTLSNPSDPRMVTWGWLDLPAAGQQRPLTFDLSTGGATLIAGTARSGRTTAARTIAMAIAARHSPEQFQVWAIDSGAGLADLAGLAHCGGIIPAHDLDRIERLLAHLTVEVARRRLDPTEDRSALMLIVDSWEGVAAANDDRDASRVTDTLLRLAVDGPAAGLHTMVTTDRAGLVGRVGAVTSDRIVLRLADPGDYALVGMSARDVPRRLPAGRGVRADDLALLQVALADDAVTVAAGRWPRGKSAVPRFDPLPRLVAFTDLPAAAPAADQIALGLNAADLTTVRIARADISTSFLVIGPPGSGRSTALALLAGQLGGRRLAISCLHRSPLIAASQAIHLPRDDQDHAVAILDSLCASAAALPDLLIDDIDLLGEGALWARLEDLIRSPAGGDQIIAIGSSIDSMSAAFRGPIAAARHAKTGLLLCPSSPHDGEVLGLRLPRHLKAGDPPGRGWLAKRGSATRVQLADPGASSDHPITELAPLVA